MPEDYTPPSLEDRLQEKLEGLTEGHKRILIDLFSNLNEDNQQLMISTCETREGINGLIDFAIQNRGE
jgi:hypothetical protein